LQKQSHETGPRANNLLAALPKSAYDRLAPHFEAVTLAPRSVLVDGNAPLEHVYFPHSGFICLMASTRDGVAETAAIGSEGFVGFEAVLGGETAANRALVQLPGVATRVPVNALRTAIDIDPAIRDSLLRYVRFFLIQALQSVACNGLHTVEERCAKWLLTAHDRSGGTDTLNLTQEFLAEVLGVHRPSVTIVARTLQTAGLIRYSRGVIALTDRKGLEEASCDCYSIVRRALEETFPSIISE
jgi:CRP-like cAMP-binding protein